MNTRHKEIITFQSQRLFTVVCKRFLNILESLQKDNQNNLDKLYEALPREYHALLSMSDILDSNRFSYIRKQIFDVGGECNRELLGELDKYDLVLIRKEE